MPSTTVSVPSPNNYPTPSYQFNNPKYLFEECSGAEQAFSLMLSGNDPLMRWMPVEAVNNLNEHIAHWSYAVPEGYDGSQPFSEWMLDGEEIGLCEYAPAGMELDICQYSVPFQRFTFSTSEKPLTVGARGGIQYCNTEPRGYMRGEFAGLRFEDDYSWVMSGMAVAAEKHMQMVLRQGSATGANIKNGNNDGIEMVLTPGYVQSHKIGQGGCVAEDPYIINAAPVTVAVEMAEAIGDAIETILARGVDMGEPISPENIALRINPMMWKYIVENAMANGDYFTRIATRNIESRTTPTEFIEWRNEFMRGGAGFGYFPSLYGYNIPIIPDAHAATMIKNGNQTSMLGEATIMTKFWNGRNTLAQQYLDYRQIPEIADSGAVIEQNGLFRVTEVDYNKTCWVWNMEAQWRFVSRMQRLQGRVLNLNVPIRPNNIFETSQWAHANFYAHDGQPAHVGIPTLTPLDFN